MAQKILVAGAGKSSASLIHYLLSRASSNNWEVIIADNSLEAARAKAGGHPQSRPVQLDINNAHDRAALVAGADIVVSLMPPTLHVLLAEDCLAQGKHLITSSYISPQMAAMDEAVKAAGLMFMCEMGLDPGIDHMSAMQILDDIHTRGGKLIFFKSYCGGLVAPESDDNPWHYKFTWNPRNVITAGADGAQYLEGGQEKMVGYKDMFAPLEPIHVEGLGELAYYPNRDSLHYIQLYDVPEVQDFMRATLRYPAFIKAWNELIQGGLTNVDVQHDFTGMNRADWMTKALAPENIQPDIKAQLDWLGLYEDAPMPLTHGTNGDALLAILLEKWAMQPGDKDMVVMQHEVVSEAAGRQQQLISSMIVIGDNEEETAMAKTVGLPMALLAEGILNGSIQPVAGVHIPIAKSIYEPLLRGLDALGISFRETLRPLG